MQEGFAGLDRSVLADEVAAATRAILARRLDTEHANLGGCVRLGLATHELRAGCWHLRGAEPAPAHPQYSSASLTVSTRTVSAGSVGSGEAKRRSRS